MLSEVYADMQNQDPHGRFLLRGPKRSRAIAVRRFSFPNEPANRNEIMDAVPNQHVSCEFRYRPIDYDAGVGNVGQQLWKLTNNLVGATVGKFGERLENRCRSD
jgi:hypothetical protein